MKRLLVFLALISVVAESQQIRFRRGSDATRATATLASGEPGFSTDSLDLWIGSDSGQVLIGGRSVVYGKATFAKDAGSTDAYAITLVPAPTKYWQGMRIAFRANTANTGKATLNVNSLGAKTIYKGPAASDTLITGDISSGELVEVIYADSAFCVVNVVNPGNNLQLLFVPFSPDVDATGNNWTNGQANNVKDSIICFFKFTVSQNILPDSAVMVATTGATTEDSMKYAIYSTVDSTLLCETSWKVSGAASGAFRFTAPFTTTTTLLPGTYFFAYAHTRESTNAAFTTYVNAGLLWTTGHTFLDGSMRTTTIAWGGVFPSRLSGTTTLLSANLPVALIIGR